MAVRRNTKMNCSLYVTYQGARGFNGAFEGLGLRVWVRCIVFMYYWESTIPVSECPLPASFKV